MSGADWVVAAAWTVTGLGAVAFFANLVTTIRAERQIMAVLNRKWLTIRYGDQVTIVRHPDDVDDMGGTDDESDTEASAS